MSDAARRLNELAAKLAPAAEQDPTRRPSQPVRRRKVRITTVNADGSVTAEFAGTPALNVQVQSHVTPVVGQYAEAQLIDDVPQVTGQVGATPWLIATLENGASNFSGGGLSFSVVSYAGLPGGMLGFKGQLVQSTANSVVFHLPAELTPLSDRQLIVGGWSGSAWGVGSMTINRRGHPTNPRAVTLLGFPTGQQIVLDGLSVSIY